MPDLEKAEAKEEECGFGRCVKEHPLHCCHTAYTKWYRGPTPNTLVVGWVCDCGKMSRVWTVVRDR
jgi:hypothetical protein